MRRPVPVPEPALASAPASRRVVVTAARRSRTVQRRSTAVARTSAAPNSGILSGEIRPRLGLHATKTLDLEVEILPKSFSAIFLKHYSTCHNSASVDPFHAHDISKC